MSRNGNTIKLQLDNSNASLHSCVDLTFQSLLCPSQHTECNPEKDT